MPFNDAPGAAPASPITAPGPSSPPAPEAIKPPAQHTDDCQLRQRIFERAATTVHYRKFSEWTSCTCWCHELTPAPVAPARRGRSRKEGA